MRGTKDSLVGIVETNSILSDSTPYQLITFITITISREYNAMPPPIKKTAQFLITVAVAIDFIWYTRSGQV